MKPYFKDVDFLEEARERATEQFRDKKVFDKYLDVMLYNNIGLLEEFKDLKQLLNVDNASGETLDLIGRIVGQERIITDITTIIYFAFEGYALGTGYGAIDNLGSTGNYKDLYDTSEGEKVLLSDIEYRLFIKAKMFKNNMSATPKGLIDLIEGVVGRRDVIKFEDGGARVKVFLSSDLTLLEKAILKFAIRGDQFDEYYLPIPVGVGGEFAEFTP